MNNEAFKITLTLEELIASNVHLGDKKSKSHTTMQNMVIGYKNGNSIINLDKTMESIEEVSLLSISNILKNKQVLLVGLQPHVAPIIKEMGQKYNLPYIINSWKNGTLTNFENVIVARKNKLQELELKLKRHEQSTNKDSQYILSAKDLRFVNKEIERIKKNFEGLSNFNTIPNVIILVDSVFSNSVIKEANKVGNILVVCLCDTNNNISNVNFPIPANTQSQSSVKLILEHLMKPIKYAQDKFQENKKQNRSMNLDMKKQGYLHNK